MNRKVLIGITALYLHLNIASASAELIHESTDFPERNVQFIYVSDDAYRFFVTTDRVTEVRLQPGEQLVTIYSGTTDGLMVSNMLTKNDNGKVYETIFIKPTIAKLSTNMSIVTNRRLYRLLVLTDENYYNPIISWRYLLDEQANRQRSLEKIKEELAVIPPILKLSKNNFRYVSTSEKEITWKPDLIYDYGGKIYIKMPKEVTTENLPVLFSVNDKKMELVNYRFRQGYFIVDRMSKEIHLVYGNEKVIIQPLKEGESRSAK